MTFSETVLDHFYNPRHVGSLETPDGCGYAGSPERGVFMSLELELDENRVHAACFQTYGCVPAIATGSFLCEWLQGRSLEQASALTPDELEEKLGGLPPSMRFCVQLAVEALQAALREAESKVNPC